jgi:adenine-specific DNA-methyltransferase
MAKKQQKLELTWIGKGDEPTLEPRILIENPEYSYGDSDSENMLIHGDNLLALKALEQDYTGKVKCIYIDPPYNTGNAFEHYDDNLEHSIWLDLMYQRIKILYNLLSNEGVFCLHLDDQEVFYAKVICDEIFGRDMFVSSIAVKSSTPSGLKTAHRDKTIIKQKDLVLVYKKTKNLTVNPQYIPRPKWDSHYSKYYERETNEVKNLIDVLLEQGIIKNSISIKSLNIKDKKFKKFYLENKFKIFQTQPTMPAEEKAKSRASPKEIIKYIDSEGIENFAINGRRFVFLENSLNELEDESLDLATLLCDFWSDIDFQNTQNEGANSFPAGKKPERIIARFLKLFTQKGDLVMDSFLGSGTTSAVSHKMNRKYIGIEMGDHAYTHSYERLKNIVTGTDNSGISETFNWQGGGGFKFYELAPSLLNKDQYDNWVISKEYNANMLAAAMAKQEGFSYSPNTDNYWQQGFSSEQDFIYTTTQFVTVELLDQLHDQLQEGDSLLICAKKFQRECANRFGNISLKKIPQMLLGKCEFAKEDYSLNIINLPQEDDINETKEDFENE